MALMRVNNFLLNIYTLEISWAHVIPSISEEYGPMALLDHTAMEHRNCSRCYALYRTLNETFSLVFWLFSSFRNEKWVIYTFFNSEFTHYMFFSSYKLKNYENNTYQSHERDGRVHEAYFSIESQWPGKRASCLFSLCVHMWTMSQQYTDRFVWVGIKMT